MTNSTKNTVVVYGPHASGKTRNAEALMRHFGCELLHDEFLEYHENEPLTMGALHLTTVPPELYDLYIIMHARVYSIEEALKMLSEGQATQMGGPSQHDLITFVVANIVAWVQEEAEVNGDGVPIEQRWTEHAESFLAELEKALLSPSAQAPSGACALSDIGAMINPDLHGGEQEATK